MCVSSFLLNCFHIHIDCSIIYSLCFQQEKQQTTRIDCARIVLFECLSYKNDDADDDDDDDDDDDNNEGDDEE